MRNARGWKRVLLVAVLGCIGGVSVLVELRILGQRDG